MTSLNYSYSRTKLTANNIREYCVIHYFLPTCQWYQSVNKNKVDIYLIPAISKASGAFVLIEAPITIGNPLAIFRDIIEFMPYMPPPHNDFPHLINERQTLVTYKVASRTLNEEQLGFANLKNDDQQNDDEEDDE